MLDLTGGVSADALTDTTTIIFRDPCSKPVEFYAPVKAKTVTWNYSELLQIRVEPFVVEPSNAACSILFNCENTVGPLGSANLCKSGDFNESTGELTLAISGELVTDREAYPPGLYEIAIIGALGDK